MVKCSRFHSAVVKTVPKGNSVGPNRIQQTVPLEESMRLGLVGFITKIKGSVKITISI